LKPPHRDYVQAISSGLLGKGDRVIDAKTISDRIGGKVLGSLEATAEHPSPIESSDECSLTFCSKRGREAIDLINATKARIVICSMDLQTQDLNTDRKTIILVENPRMAMIQTMEGFFDQVERGISPLAQIEEGTKIGSAVYIGPFCHIESCVVIGDNVKIGSGTVIGKEGFGFEREMDGQLVRFPHIGGVRIEDDVEIGSNVSIDRGTLGDTVIGEGTKVDNLCHIAHNVYIGRHCMIIAQSMLAGSSSIGDYTTVAPCACVREKVRVGKNCLIGLGAVVTKDIEDGWVAYGSPAKPVRKVERKFGPDK